VSFIVCVALCAVFRAWCDILFDMCISVLGFDVVPLPPGKTRFAVQTNDNENITYSSNPN
jgi:hypothetical protein